jgi:hypothetical protein
LAELSGGPTSIHVVRGANIQTSPGHHLAETSATVNPQETMLDNDLQLSLLSTPVAFASGQNFSSSSWPDDTFGDQTMAVGENQEASAHIGDSVPAI